MRISYSRVQGSRYNARTGNNVGGAKGLTATKKKIYYTHQYGYHNNTGLPILYLTIIKVIPIILIIIITFFSVIIDIRVFHFRRCWLLSGGRRTQFLKKNSHTTILMNAYYFVPTFMFIITGTTAINIM